MSDRIKSLKQELVQIKKEIKKEKKLEKRVVGGGILSWFSNRADNATIALYMKLDKKAKEITQKRIDPIGYEADKLVEEATAIVATLEKIILKGKIPSKKQIKLVSQLHIALGRIASEELGYRWEDARDLLVKLDSFNGPVPDEVTKGLLAMVDQMRATVTAAQNNPRFNPTSATAEKEEEVRDLVRGLSLESGV